MHFSVEMFYFMHTLQIKMLKEKNINTPGLMAAAPYWIPREVHVQVKYVVLGWGVGEHEY
jgi:hypothetical protein